MAPIHPQSIADDNQRRQAVVLSLAQWEQVVEKLEQLDDIRAYDRAKARSQEGVPFEHAVREIEKDCDR
jgi:hypothetical protein